MMRQKGQSSTAEYAVMILLVMTAVMVVTVYVRRALQGRIHDAGGLAVVRAAGALGNAVMTEYEPYYANSASSTDMMSTREEGVSGLGGLVTQAQTTSNTASISSQAAPENR